MSKLLKLEEGWNTALFLLGAVLAAAWVLVAAGWTEGLDVIPRAGAGGLAAGLFLGWSVFRARTCHLFGAIYGLAWVGFLLGSGLPGELTWGERIAELAARLSYWVGQAVGGGTGHDALIFVMLLSGLFWILGYSAAWNTYRRMRVWRAVLPPGIVALINVYYYYGPAPLMRYLAFYLFFALLYVARSHVFEQEKIWRRERVAYDPVLRVDFLRAGLALTLVVLALAWALPSVASVSRLAEMWREFSDPWRTVQEEWQRLFSTLRGNPVVGIVEPFGSSLALGGPREVEDVILMDIAAPRAGRYYWRGAVYSHYDGDRWEAVENEQILLIPGRQPSGMARDALRHTVVQTVTTYVPKRHLLVGASQPVAVDQEAKAHVHLAEDAPLEFIRIFSVSVLEADDQYAVTSQVSEADATSLRQAGTDYPDWVRRRYLQLPASLSDRVRQLAEEITADAENPYDRAVALERYLRQNITYDLTPPDRPAGREYVDFMLFSSRRDYCNGYATAMVVLARSVDIPARLAVGYGQGEYDADRGVFRVSEANTHSWPEIYFPGYGWIEFEPTASERPLIRPNRPAEEAADGDQVPGARREPPEEMGEGMGRNPPELDETLEWDAEPLAAGRGRLVWSWAVGLTLVALAAGGWWAAENWGFRGLPAVEQAYARLLRFGRWLGRPLRVSDTPFEWGRAVSAIVPEAQEPIGRIVDLYVHARFARGTPGDPEAQAAWTQARPVLWYRWLRQIVPVSRIRGWFQRIASSPQLHSWLKRLAPFLERHEA
jgi:transglutaminase-like putative cysteine protease